MTGVSLIIAAYNAQHTIGRAITSALAQAEAAQVIVVDDASNDQTKAVAHACDDGSGRLLVLVQASNQGPSAARNLGLAHAHADWVGVLDADDYLAPGRLEKLLLEAGDYDLVADDLLRLNPLHSDAPSPAWAVSVPRDIDFLRFVQGNVTETQSGALELGFAKPIMRHAFLTAHDLRYDAKLRLGEDFDLYARALAWGARMRLIPAAGYISVESTGSLSKNHGATELAAMLGAIKQLSKARKFNRAERGALAAHAQSLDKRLQWRRLIDAVKARDAAASASAFKSPTIALHLMGCLCEQAWLRAFNRPRLTQPGDRTPISDR